MSDDPFENELGRMFRKPSGEADPSRLKAMILERVEREDRRRRLVIVSATGVGAAIAAGVASATRFESAFETLAAKLSGSLPVVIAGGPNVWLWAVFGLGLCALFAGRAVRDL